VAADTGANDPSETPADDTRTESTSEPSDSEHTGADESGARDAGFDLKSLLRQLTTPMVESLDSRLRDQIEAHVDELLDEKVDAAIRDRLSTLDRAVADLSRSLDELEKRLAES
jgi:hypothetical protein